VDNIIEFPKLGLEFNINDVAFDVIGNFEIKWYGIIICFGFLLSIILAMRVCENFDISKDDLLDYLLFAMPAAIVGARLFYVVFAFDEYKDNLKEIFNIRQGGLAIYGGVIFAVITVFIVSKVKKKSVLNVLDFAAPYIMLGQAIGRWGNFTNQEAFGGATNLPWGMTGNLIKERLEYYGLSRQQLVHPTFLYESLICFVGFAFMMIYRKRWQKEKGEILCLYMIIYGIARAIIESLRVDSLMLGNVRVSRLISIVIFVLGITLLIDIRRRHKLKMIETSEEESSLRKIVEVIETSDEEDTMQEAEALEAARQAELMAYELQDEYTERE
jgi:phosphatidylglycerol:prolipoprotein diacylglycerol transferase